MIRWTVTTPRNSKLRTMIQTCLHRRNNCKDNPDNPVGLAKLREIAEVVMTGIRLLPESMAAIEWHVHEGLYRYHKDLAFEFLSSPFCGWLHQVSRSTERNRFVTIVLCMSPQGSWPRTIQLLFSLRIIMCPGVAKDRSPKLIKII